MFLYHGKYIEAQKQALDNEQTATENGRRATANATEASKLKQMIGLADKPLSEVEDQFAKDKETYGKNFPEDSQFYSPMLSHLWDAVLDRSKENASLNDKLKDLDLRFAIREGEKDKQIQELNTAVAESGNRLTQAITAFDDYRGTLEKEQVVSRESRYGRQGGEGQDGRLGGGDKPAANRSKRLKISGGSWRKWPPGYGRTTMDVPCGDVTHVDQHARTVWINIGRDDGLQRQMSFGVYGADNLDLGKAKKKATIEVTQIQGDHMAEARIVDDSDSDPIAPGDKIFTPLWSRGERSHFALAGVMNIDGDGRHAWRIVRNLIGINGGEVDCYADDSGKMAGGVTADTRSLIKGDDPKDSVALDTMSKIIRDAERVGATS